MPRSGGANTYILQESVSGALETRFATSWFFVPLSTSYALRLLQAYNPSGTDMQAILELRKANGDVFSTTFVTLTALATTVITTNKTFVPTGDVGTYATFFVAARDPGTYAATPVYFFALSEESADA